MLRKIAAMVLLALGAMAFAPLATSASTGYQLDNISDSSPSPGQAVTVVCNGFDPGTNATITLDPGSVVLGTFVSAPGEFGQGVVEATVTIPSDTSTGSYSLVCTGVDSSGASKTVAIQITVSSASGGLPSTGTNLLLLLSIGGLTVLLGWALLGSTRRRHAIG